MAQSYDAIIVGAGHNRLTCGTYLAQAGLNTLVLERRHVIGGAAVTEEVVPGYKFSVCSYVFGMMPERIVRELELHRFGLEILPTSDLFCPTEDGGFILLSGDMRRTQESFARFSTRDAETFPAFEAHLREAADILRQLLWETPVDPSKRDWRSLKELASLVWRYRKVGGRMYRVADLLTQSADDYLSRWFEHDVVKGMLAYYSSVGTFAGPRSPGTAYVLIHHLMNEHDEEAAWGFARGGMGAVSNAIAASGARFGLEVKTDSPVAEVMVENGRARGVRTAAGDEYRARVVISNANCRTLFGKLVGRDQLPTEFMAEIDSYRTFSTAFKINLATGAPPSYRAFDKAKCGFDYPSLTHLGPTVDYLERAYDDAKYGWYSARPFISPVVPTMADDTLAPPGKHVVSLFGGHAPYELRNGLWEQERDNMVRNVMGVMDDFAPGFSSQVIDAQVLLPPDFEEIFDLPQGHIFHGELLPDQLFSQRPAPHYADYRSPIVGLYQCGSSTHPGGGVTGVPGHNAAREILKDWRKIRR